MNMHVALIIFADKSHYDHHGALATTPLILTLSLFNKSARNRGDFWRPMAYLPNLSYGGTSAKQEVFRMNMIVSKLLCNH